MREYRNQDSKTNDEESDPCIAAEARMKKSVMSSRTRRTIIALFIVLAVIAFLSVLLFIIIPRSQKTSEENESRKFEQFAIPLETTSISLFSSARFSFEDNYDTYSANSGESTQRKNVLEQLEDKIGTEKPSSTVSQRISVSNMVTSRPVFITSKSGQAVVPSSSVATIARGQSSEATYYGKERKEPRNLPSTAAFLPTSEEFLASATSIVDLNNNISPPTTAFTLAQINGTSVSPVLYHENTVPIGNSKSYDIYHPKVNIVETRLSEILRNQDDEAFLTVNSGDSSTISTTISDLSFQSDAPFYETVEAGVPDSTLSEMAQNCEELFSRGVRRNGIHAVSLPGLGDLEIVCDMTTSPGGWNVIQRRYNGSVGFHNRSWKEYEDGFGSLRSSFWLGLQKIYALVLVGKGKMLTLRIEIRGDRCEDGEKCSQLPDGFWFGEWDFKVASPEDNYTLSLSPAKAGNLTEHDSRDKFFYMSNGLKFTTIDRDNDRLAKMNCAEFRDFGGWWHNDCGYGALNGRYEDTAAKMRGLFWHYFASSSPRGNYYIKPRYTEMKIRL